jgi:hypothetical protein
MEGTACVNSDEVATFFGGQFRVALQGIRERRIGAAILGTTGDETPIHTTCPFVWTTGLAAGNSMNLMYIPAPEDAGEEDSLEWILHVESVRDDSARVFVERRESRFEGQALRDLRRRVKEGKFTVQCGSTAPGQVEYPRR